MSEPPVGHGDDSYREPPDVETELTASGIGQLFVGREQISERRGETRLLKLAGNIPIAGAVSAATAAVCEHDQSRGPVWNHEVGVQRHTRDGYLQYLVDLAHERSPRLVADRRRGGLPLSRPYNRSLCSRSHPAKSSSFCYSRCLARCFASLR